jgi:hypothetical protein
MPREKKEPTHEVEYLGAGFLDFPNDPENELPKMLSLSPPFPLLLSRLFFERAWRLPRLEVSLSFSFSFDLTGDVCAGEIPSFECAEVGAESPFELEDPCRPNRR